MELIFGGGRIDRRAADVEDLLRAWREKEKDWGQLSLEYEPITPKALEETTNEDREFVAGVIGTMTSWPWLGASLATKTLHKKRPALIPVLDQAILGAYINPRWPERRSLADTIKAVARIKEALDWIAEDLTRPENSATWAELHAVEPDCSRIELFDMVWWMYFRSVEPVVVAPPA